MTAKEFLSRAWQIEKRIDARIDERERLESLLTSPRTAKLTGMPRGGGGDWTNAVIAVSDLNAVIVGEIETLCRIKREVIEAIDAVEDARYKRLLELRYRNYMSWDDIASEMGYTTRNIFELHGKALQRVRVPSADKNNK